jgi:hypothetical protein
VPGWESFDEASPLEGGCFYGPNKQQHGVCLSPGASVGMTGGMDSVVQCYLSYVWTMSTADMAM